MLFSVVLFIVEIICAQTWAPTGVALSFKVAPPVLFFWERVALCLHSSGTDLFLWSRNLIRQHSSWCPDTISSTLSSGFWILRRKTTK